MLFDGDIIREIRNLSDKMGELDKDRYSRSKELEKILKSHFCDILEKKRGRLSNVNNQYIASIF